jgi:hypothetical protein
MNPANSQHPLLQDIAVPTPNPAQPLGATTDIAAPSLVANIPVKQPGGPIAASPDEEAELDKIMRDVGHELKRDDQKPAKKRFLSFGHRVKIQPPAAQSQAPAQPLQPVPKPAKPSSVPVLTITLTIIVTGVLITAAFLAYKK